MYLRQLFRILFRTRNHQYDYTFDWTMLKQKAVTGTGAVATAGAAAGIPTPGERPSAATLAVVPSSSHTVSKDKVRVEKREW
jgi:hypothetical protein